MRRSPGLALDYWSSALTASHEFGHYGFDLGDEYADGDDNTFCAANLRQESGAFRGGEAQASCMMYSQQVAGKLCSGRPENRHRTGTWQGDENCWAHLAGQYRDRARFPRWFVRTPDTRGAIVGRLPDLPTDWRPRVNLEDRARPGLCAPLTMVVRDRETLGPMNDVDTWVRTSYGQNISQGNTGSYDSGAGVVRFNDGEITVTGVHVGDRITFHTNLFFGSEYVVTRDDCASAARLGLPAARPASFLPAGFSPGRAWLGSPPQKQATLNVTLAPEPFALSAKVEPTARQDEAVIRVQAGAPLESAPSVSVNLSGDVKSEPVAMRFDPATGGYLGRAAGLPAIAHATIRVDATGADGRSVTRFFSMAVSPLSAQDATALFSANGQFALHAPAGAFPAGARVAIGPSGAPPPALAEGLVLVSGPFGVAASTGGRMARAGLVRFQLPNLRGARAADGFDPGSFEVRRYAPPARRWESLGGNLLTSADVLSVPTDRLGDYAVVARPLPPATGGAFAVTGVTLAPDEAKPSGPCPVRVTFTGRITANGPGTVKYTFVRSDGATGPVFALEFKEAGTQRVTTSWTLGGAGLPTYEGWQAIRILSPGEAESDRGEGRFQMSCGAPPKSE